MSTEWIEAGQWKSIQESVPIACADVLVVQRERGIVRAVGLIHRDTPHQGRRWCLVGGRMLRNESFAEGVTRQLRQTLGAGISFTLAEDLQPDYVAQYFTERRTVGNVDPRQHAVGLTFGVEVRGEACAKGEALAFQWFDVDELPPAEQWGFEQDRVARAVLRRVRA